MKKLEELLGMESRHSVTEIEESPTNQIIEKASPVYRNARELDKIAESLPKVKGLGDTSDAEFDALANRATQAYDDLMDLGMNVEARYSGKIFEVASVMLKNAIEAKTAKMDKKLKMIDLQLRKYKLEKDKGDTDNSIDVSNTSVIVSDRNSLLEKLKNMTKD